MLDVAVVGASAAGLFAGSLLAERGYKVGVFERSRALQPTSRSLIVTRELRPLLGSRADRSIYGEIHQFDLRANGRVALIKLREPDLVIERSTLISDLAEHAEANGACISYGARFEKLEPTSGGLKLHFSNRSITARTVIGADGAFSAVARSIGNRPQPTAPLVQAVIEGQFDDSTSIVWFRPQDTPYFYWLIPDAQHRAVLGVIGVDGSAARTKLDQFMTERGMKPTSYQAARIPLYGRKVLPHKKLGNGHVYLVGDAAGQVKVSTVGGIVTGFRGALAAVNSITSGNKASHLFELRRELSLHLLVRRIIHNFSQEDYVRLLDFIDGRAKQKLETYSRDEPGKLMMQLAVAEPRLLYLAARGLVRTKAQFA
ncbi:MAG: NAD(P)/FAD-dependent oxidoreductase [Actinomycetota bacterium]